jgi:hypothetical protein
VFFWIPAFAGMTFLVAINDVVYTNENFVKKDEKGEINNVQGRKEV